MKKNNNKDDPAAKAANRSKQFDEALDERDRAHYEYLADKEDKIRREKALKNTVLIVSFTAGIITIGATLLRNIDKPSRSNVNKTVTKDQNGNILNTTYHDDGLDDLRREGYI